jgi:hypothetical protein
MVSGRPVAQDGIIAYRQHRGQAARLLGQPLLTNRINGAMKRVQPPPRHPMLNRFPTDASLQELTPGHHPVLPLRHGRNRSIDLASL